MHNVPLSSEERQVVLDYATRLERRSRYWRVCRWLAIGYFIFGLGLLLAVDRLASQMRTTLELPPEALKVPEKVEAKAVEDSLRSVASHGDTQVAALRAEVYLLLKVLIVVGIGTALFTYVVSDWTRHRRDRLIVRLLRSVLSDRGDEKHEKEL